METGIASCLSGAGDAHGEEAVLAERVPVGVAADLVLGGPPLVQVAAGRGPAQLGQEFTLAVADHGQIGDPGCYPVN